MSKTKLLWAARRYYLTSYDGEAINTAIRLWLRQHGAAMLYSSTLSEWHKFWSLSDVPDVDDHRIYDISASAKSGLLIWFERSDETPRLILRYRFPILSVYAPYSLPNNVSALVEEVVTPYVTDRGGTLPEPLPEMIEEDESKLIRKFETFGRRPDEATRTRTASSENTGDNSSAVHILPQVEARHVSAEEVHIPSGVAIKVKRSRTVEHTIDVNWRALGTLTLEAGFKQVLSASLVGELERIQGHAYKESETIEYEVELKGDETNMYRLTWVDLWRGGALEFSHNNRTRVLPFKFRESSRLEVAPIQDP